MTSAVAMGMTTDVTNMSRYPSLWVMPHRDKVVTVAPLCGSESRPPEEMEAILCSTWGPIPMRAPCSRKVGASASKVAPSPPEADAVMPHNRLTARTSVISGLADIEDEGLHNGKDGQPFNYGAKAHNCAGVNKGHQRIARS